MEPINFTNLRVRLAPSPTGFVHIGTLRTVLYDFLLAKHYKGKLILRIEDTDQSRFVPGAIEDLLETLKWAGFHIDEGAYLTTDKKVKERGDYGPYTQSKRLDIYKNHLDVLLDTGKAYPCFCSKQRLDELRTEQVKNKQAPKYDGLCRDLTKNEIQSLLTSGAPHVVRFKMPENKRVIFNDLIRGEIIVNTKDLDDFVLVKADNFPTYHFAVVVDDHLMKINLVTRGEEWIASSPKHQLLYEAFGWQPPYFAHFPQILNKNKKKMGKRDGDTSVKDYIDKGYLKDALINFIALLGWNAGTEQEIYTLDELVKQFSLENVHKAGAIFDKDKLDWINGLYIRQLSIDKFYDYCLPFLIKSNLISKNKSQLIITKTGQKIKPAEVKKAISLEQSRIKLLSEISEAVGFVFNDDLQYETKDLIWRKSDQPTTLRLLQALSKHLKSLGESDFQLTAIEKSIMDFITKNNTDNGTVLWPFRFALSGKAKSAGPFELASALGREKTIQRLDQAIKKLS